MRVFRFLTIILVVTLTSACTGFKPKLTDDVKQNISSIRVISVIHQDELNVQINASNGAAAGGAGFGVIGALVGAIADASVNSARSKAAEERAEPFRAAMHGTNTTTALNSVIEDSVGSIEWADVNFSTSNAESFRVSEPMKTLEEDALMLIESSYSLTPELESVEVISRVALYKNKNLSRSESKKKNGKRRIKNEPKRKTYKPIYRSGMKYQSKLHSGRYVSSSEEEREKQRNAIIAEYDGKMAKRRKGARRALEQQRDKKLKKVDRNTFEKIEGAVDTDGTVWLANNGALLRETLEAGVVELGALMALDLNDPLSAEQYKSSKQTFAAVTMAGGAKTRMMKSSAKGWVLDDTDTRQRIRLVDGFIYSLDKSDFLRPLTPLRQ